MMGNIFVVNYYYIWPVDGGGKKYLSTNILYLTSNFPNVIILQGLGSNNDIPANLKDNVRLCKICNSARKISKILSFVLFYIWSLKIIFRRHSHENVFITVGWNLTLIGFIAKLMNNTWINFLDDPMLNKVLAKQRTMELRIMSAFLKKSKYADFTILINKDDVPKFSKAFNIQVQKIIDIPPIYNLNMENDKVFEDKLLEQFGEKKIILFYGDMTYEQNKEAMTYIKNNIIPKFEGFDNKCIFVFAGKGAEGKNDKMCVYMGFLPENELFTLIRHSYLVLAPILAKHESGIKTKVVNAISLGTPVLSTPAGVYGLEQEGLPAFVSCIDDFSSKLKELICNEDEVKKMRELTKVYIKKFYTEKVMDKWKKIIDINM